MWRTGIEQVAVIKTEATVTGKERAGKRQGRCPREGWGKGAVSLEKERERGVVEKKERKEERREKGCGQGQQQV